MSLIKSISGIRGTIGGAAGDNLTPLDIVKFTAAYAAYISRGVQNRPRVVVGRDARLSGAMVRDLVVGTLQGCGVDVIDAGLCSTPGVELAVTHYGAAGGIVLTASHNPRQWNALKLLDANGEFLSAEAGAEILQMVENSQFASVDDLGHIVETVDFTQSHIDKVLALPLVETEAVRRRGFRVVVDGVDSVGGVVIPALLEQLGCEVVRLNCEPTGEFSHNPEPLPENLTEISRMVVAERADLGIVVDPDVDRLALVNEDGSMFGEEYTLVAVADYVLGRTPGNTVSNLSSTRALRDVTERHGGQYFAAAVGEVNVVNEMKRTGAVIGGEGNGGVIYPDSHYGRDALVGVALFLSHLAHKGLRMSELRATYPDYYISKNRVDLTPETDVEGLLEAVKNGYRDQKITDIDGVKIDFEHGWVHLRRSNTEPIVRIYSEAPTRGEAEDLAAQIMDAIWKCR